MQLVYEKRYVGAIIHILLSILSFGYYWFWMAKNSRNNHATSLLNQSYEPKNESDVELLMYNGIVKEKNSNNYISTSRLGSVDHKL